ncbi:MAG: hypothetical protein LBT18_01505, partial [Endomicrobium sp.]|nr:hypothetical protein [Endomicrobium sp.]
LDLEASCTVPVWRSLSMGLGCEIYSCGSLQGQRHATANMLDKTGSKLDKDGYSCNVFAFMSYRY